MIKAKDLADQACACLREGRRHEAAILFRECIGLDPCVDVYARHGEALMPGPGYRERLSELHQAVQPEIYLEIGVSKGRTLSLASNSKRIIGIDPAMQTLEQPPGHAECFLQTSDTFFADTISRLQPPLGPINLAFIDGLHLFEQTLRDFLNVEALANAGGVIVLHDTLPVSREVATREQRFGSWCGDVWKVPLLLERYRPDLHIETMATAPSGMTIVRQLDPENTYLRDNFDRIVGEYRECPFSMLEGRLEQLLASTSPEIPMKDMR